MVCRRDTPSPGESHLLCFENSERKTVFRKITTDVHCPRNNRVLGGSLVDMKLYLGFVEG